MLQRLSKKAKIFGSAAILCAATALRRGVGLVGTARSGELLESYEHIVGRHRQPKALLLRRFERARRAGL